MEGRRALDGVWGDRVSGREGLWRWQDVQAPIQAYPGPLFVDPSAVDVPEWDVDDRLEDDKVACSPSRWCGERGMRPRRDGRVGTWRPQVESRG
jgi:hypothetical protein